MEPYNTWLFVPGSLTRHHVFKFIHVVASDGASSLFMAEEYSAVWMDHVLFSPFIG